MKLNATTFPLPKPAIYFNDENGPYMAVGLFIQSEAEAETLTDPYPNGEVTLKNEKGVTSTIMVTHLEKPVVHPILANGRILHDAYIDDPQQEDADIFMGYQGDLVPIHNKGVQKALGLSLQDDADEMEQILKETDALLRKTGIGIDYEKPWKEYLVKARAFMADDVVCIATEPVSTIQFRGYYEPDEADETTIINDTCSLVRAFAQALIKIRNKKEPYETTVRMDFKCTEETGLEDFAPTIYLIPGK